MKHELALQQALDLSAGIDAIAKVGVSVKVLASIDLAMNSLSLKPFVEGYEKSIAFSDEYQSYLKQRLEIQKEEALKKDGEPVMVKNIIVFENPERAKKRIEAFEAENKPVVEQRKAIEQDVEVSLEKVVEVDLVKVQKGAFSGDAASGASVGVFKALAPILVDGSEKK